jgi:hypothetical protein
MDALFARASVPQGMWVSSRKELGVQALWGEKTRNSASKHQLKRSSPWAAFGALHILPRYQIRKGQATRHHEPARDLESQLERHGVAGGVEARLAVAVEAHLAVARRVIDHAEVRRVAVRRDVRQEGTRAAQPDRQEVAVASDHLGQQRPWALGSDEPQPLS